MRFGMVCGFVCSLILGAVCVRAETPLNEARDTLGKWVQTRQLISQTATDWQTDKETLEQTISLFERELEKIRDQRSQVTTNSTQVDKERETALAEQKELEEALARVESLAGGFEAKIKGLAPALPAPLTERIQSLLQRIPEKPEETRMTGLQRLQNVVGIVNEIDKFNAAVAVVNEVRRNPEGAEVQVETIYVGLGQAYFTDKPGDYAGVGIPSAEGWQWTARPELAGSIRKSIAMYQNAVPAAYVGLPVEIK